MSMYSDLLSLCFLLLRSLSIPSVSVLNLTLLHILLFLFFSGFLGFKPRFLYSDPIFYVFLLTRPIANYSSLESLIQVIIIFLKGNRRDEHVPCTEFRSNGTSFYQVDVSRLEDTTTDDLSSCPFPKPRSLS